MNSYSVLVAGKKFVSCQNPCKFIIFFFFSRNSLPPSLLRSLPPRAENEQHTQGMRYTTRNIKLPGRTSFSTPGSARGAARVIFFSVRGFSRDPSPAVVMVTRGAGRKSTVTLRPRTGEAREAPETPETPQTTSFHKQITDERESGDNR